MKLENILVQKNGYLKVSDFGCSLKTEGMRHYDSRGTLLYMAPEMIERRGGYSYSVDWWALGIITYVLLFVENPFVGKDLEINDETLRQNIMHGCFIFDSSNKVSDNCKNFISGLLKKEEQRLGFKEGASEVLDHPWLKDKDLSHQKILNKEIKSPYKFAVPSNSKNSEYYDQECLLK